MKLIALMCIGTLCAIGCESALPHTPGTATARIKIIAKPKSGVVEPITHVAVYDAAPKPAKASGDFEHVDYSNLESIIVWLEPSVGQPRGFHLNLEVKVNQAAPSMHVHAAHIGELIELRNRSSKPISLYSVSDGNDFELPSIPPGASKSYTIRAEGLIEILADPSQPPVALVYAAPSLFVAEAQAGKTISFNDVPPGHYRVQSWHPRLPGSSTDIDLAANQVTTATLTLGVNSLPHAP